MSCSSKQINETSSLEIQTSGRIKIATVNWPADLDDPMEQISEKLKKCFNENIVEICDNAEVIDHKIIRDAIFPYLEPNTQPGSVGKFSDLLSDPKVNSRLKSIGINLVVSFSGDTQIKELLGYGALTHAGVYGVVLLYENSRVEINIWQIENISSVSNYNINKGDYSLFIGIGLPVPLYANTIVGACEETSELIKNHIITNHPNIGCQ